MEFKQQNFKESILSPIPMKAFYKIHTSLLNRKIVSLSHTKISLKCKVEDSLFWCQCYDQLISLDREVCTVLAKHITNYSLAVLGFNLNMFSIIQTIFWLIKLFFINGALQRVSVGSCYIKTKKLLIHTFKIFQSKYSYRS